MNKLVWMDSGAFSAKTLGAEISLRRYCQWLQRHKKAIDHYAVLDAIGSDRTSAQTTWDNQMRMESEFDLAPVPCFHYGEPFEYLEKYVEGWDYIALGGMVPVETKQLSLWLDEVWNHYLTRDDGAPIVKVHGFGMTTFSLMARYPWFSVDSSSWLMGGRNGTALFMVNGAPTALGCSAKSAGKGTLAGLGWVQRVHLLAQAAHALGHSNQDDIEQLLSESYIARNLLTLHTFEEWRKLWVQPIHTYNEDYEPSLFPQFEEADLVRFRELNELEPALTDEHKLQIFYAGCWPGGWKQLPPYPRMFSYHYIDQHGGKKAVNFNMVDEFNAIMKARENGDQA